MSALLSRFLCPARTACALALCLSGVVQAESVNLRPKFEPGAQARYNLVIDVANTATITGSADAQKRTIAQELGVSLVVKEADASTGAKVDLVFDSFKIKMDDGRMPVQFDSSVPAEQTAENPLDGLFRPLVGTTLHLVVDSTGTITEVTGGEDISRGPAGRALNSYVSKAGVTSFMGPIFSAKHPTGQANVGESWTHEDAMPASAMGQMQLVSKHTLTSMQDGAANIDINGTIEEKPADAASKVDVREGSFKGVYIWDTGAGMLKSMKTTMNLSIAGDLGGGATAAGSTSTTTITRLK